MPVWFLLCGLIAGLFSSAVWAVPANPDFAIFVQPDGVSFEARTRGDEFFSWRETREGYPIAQQPETGWWMYLRPPGDTNTTVLIVGRDAPPGEPWSPAISKQGLKKQQTRSLEQTSRIPVVNAGGTRAVGEGGTAKLLTACVRFEDSPPAASLTPVSYFQQMIYGRTSDRRTVADYYHEVSGGKLRVEGEVRGWLTIPGATADYGANDDTSFSLPRLVNLVSNTVQAMRNNGVNFGDFDTDLDGFVDCLAVVFQGLGEADGGSANTIWPHQFTYSELKGASAGSAGLPTGSLNANGQPVFVDLYFTAAELNRNSSNMAATVSAPIGTFCHEFAHALGMPDLYDQTAPVSRGVGNWSLMAFGTYANGYGQAGDCPTWIDPYNRIKAGWDTEVNVTGNLINFRIPEAHDQRVVYRLWADGASGPEYFLIENRRRTGFNIGQPGEGLLIYHVDESVTTGNDQQWYLLSNGSGLVGKGNFLVALEQADGFFELERAINSGNAGDAYMTGSEFTTYTTPNSKAYNEPGTFDQGPDTFVEVKNINTDKPDAAYADIFVFADNYAPDLYVYEPGEGAVLDALTNAFGYTYDGTGVTELFAKLREKGPDGRFYDWNAGAWKSTFDASCLVDIDINDNWHLAINNALLDDGKAFELTVTARDAAGNQMEVVRSFAIDRQLFSPSLAIDSPNGETYGEPPLIQGSSSTPATTALTARRFALYAEDADAWYDWSSGVFATNLFDFGTHVDEVSGAEPSWTYALPSNLISGAYQIHAQSLNNSNRASAWTYRSFRIARAPSVNITSHAHQALLQSLGSLSGSAAPQSGYELDGFVRINIYREGNYWTGSYWTNTQATLLAPVAAGGGSWTLSEASMPENDGVYAISVSVIDTYGSWSLPVGGGSYQQNNIIVSVDNTPPEISINWPPAGYTSTVSRIPANAFAGSATDRNGQPVVRGYIRRVSDGFYWSIYGWSYVQTLGMFTASYPGGDGGSFSEWKLDPGLPEAGFNAGWCMPNGEYELIMVAFDATGNSNQVTRLFSVAYDNPLFADLPATGFNPAQNPLNTNAFALVAVTAVPPFSVDAEQPEGYHGLFAAADGSYRIVAGKLEGIGYYFNARDPVLFAANAGGKSWSVLVNNPIEYAEGYFYERNAAAPIADFRADGAGVTASGLLERDYSRSTFNNVTRAEITRFDGSGAIIWRSLTPPTNYTGWAGTASGPSGLNVKWIKLLDDDRTVVVAEFYAYAGSSYQNYRHHVLCLVLNASGQVVSANRFGEEVENQQLQENEFFIDAEVDGAGNIYVATRRVIAGNPSYHYLRKIRLSDGAMSGSYVVDSCLSPEGWSAITVDAAGWVFIGGSVSVSADQSRLLVTRVDPIGMTADWRAFGPAGSGGHTASPGDPVLMPLLASLNGSAYVAHTQPGFNSYDAGDDRFYVTRFDPAGQLLWSRELDTLDGFFTRGNQAGFSALTPAGDVLLTGEFDLSSYPYKPGYAKIAANGDLQFARQITAANIVARGLTSDRQRIILALGGIGQPLSVVALDNPVNVYPQKPRSPYDQWAYEQSLNGDNALPGASPGGYGAANLLRYAFNLSAWGDATYMTPGTGTYGMPAMRTTGAGGALRLRVEYLRRLDDTNLSYQVQFAPRIHPESVWENAASAEVITSVDATWERVVVDDHIAGAAATSRFSRVRLTLQP